MRPLGVVDFGPGHQRAFLRLFVALLAGLVVSWGGVAALITLSVLWPRNLVPPILLAVWVLSAVASVAMSGPDERWPGRPEGWAILLWAPLHPLCRAGLAFYSAWTAGSK